MSAVHLHIGQCGNQLSIPLWQTFVSSKSKGTEHVFTTMDSYHRSVHIDTERKVTATLPSTFQIREKNLVVGKRGSGTNFALGYTGLTSAGDDHVLDCGMDAIRREVERCDMYSGIVVYHSISGGTGSGLGAHLIELLRDEYPCNYILSCAVFPCADGESPLQNYNALLSLKWLQTFTDCTLLLQNDFYVSRLTQLCQSKEAGEQISFKDVNDEIANNLCGVFVPTNTLMTAGNCSMGQEPWELIRTLTPSPATKFISVMQHNSLKLPWEEMTSRLLKQYPKYYQRDNISHCISGTVITRSDKSSTLLPDSRKCMDDKIKKHTNAVHWNPYPLDFWHASQNHIGSRKGRSLTLVTNSSSVLGPLSTVETRVQDKLTSGAYLHWYEKHGFTKDDFYESLESLQSVVSNYKEAVRS